MQMTWIAINILLTLLFGVLHQGGIVPSLLFLHDRISAVDFTKDVHIIYWKTYMPPRHLLAVGERGMSLRSIGLFMNYTSFSEVTSRRINITDLAGTSSSSLYQTLLYP